MYSIIIILYDFSGNGQIIFFVILKTFVKKFSLVKDITEKKITFSQTTFLKITKEVDYLRKI